MKTNEVRALARETVNQFVGQPISKALREMRSQRVALGSMSCASLDMAIRYLTSKAQITWPADPVVEEIR